MTLKRACEEFRQAWHGFIKVLAVTMKLDVIFAGIDKQLCRIFRA